MNAHLPKPIVIDEVIKTILRYVHFDKELPNTDSGKSIGGFSEGTGK